MTRKPASFLLAAALLSVPAALAVRCKSADSPQNAKPKPIEIAIVKTWKDLLAQPQVDLEKFGKVRLGVESPKASTHGCVTVYALVDGQEGYVTGFPPQEAVGPLRVEVTLELESKKLQSSEKVMVEPHPRGTLLYRQCVPACEDSAVTVHLFSPEGTEVARTKIPQGDVAKHPWSPFGRSDDALNEKELDRAGAIEIFDEDLTAPGEGWAIPKFDGTQPLAYAVEIGGSSVRHFHEDDPLPPLTFERPPAPTDIKLPLAEDRRIAALIEQLGDEDVDARNAAEVALWRSMDTAHAILIKRLDHKDPEVRARILELLRPFEPQLTIRIADGVIWVESKRNMLINEARESFLARWWVNGKPFMPAKVVELMKISRDMQKAMAPALEAGLKVKFDLKKLGAKSGDTIGIQLLLCPDGWRYQHLEIAELEKAIEIVKTELLKTPTASNVVEWKVP